MLGLLVIVIVLCILAFTLNLLDYPSLVQQQPDATNSATSATATQQQQSAPVIAAEGGVNSSPVHRRYVWRLTVRKENGENSSASAGTSTRSWTVGDLDPTGVQMEVEAVHDGLESSSGQHQRGTSRNSAAELMMWKETTTVLSYLLTLEQLDDEQRQHAMPRQSRMRSASLRLPSSSLNQGVRCDETLATSSSSTASVSATQQRLDDDDDIVAAVDSVDSIATALSQGSVKNDSLMKTEIA